MKRFFIIASFLMLTAVPGVMAQQSMFGKNKVQYRDFVWKYIQSPHFDIYYYQGGKEMAEFCAEVAEPALESIQNTIRYDITDRISLLIYNSHNDFQQTNAVGEFLPEGVGGVTELFKNRVVVPYEGDYEKFRHVIHHELVHAVLNDMYSGGSYQALLTGGGMQIPTWMNEGLAEYESLQGLDAETDMFMRDATLANSVPSLERLGGYVQYRVGQTMYWYIAENYGKDKVQELLHRIRSSRSPDLGFRTTFGLGISEFGEKFIDFLKKQYFPDIAKFDDPASFAEVFADHKSIGNFFNSSPEISPDGNYVAYLSDRDDYFDIYVQSITNPKNIRRILKKGGSTSNFEELHLLTPGITWSPDGKKIAIASKAGRFDAVTVIDVATTDQEQIPTLNLDGIHQLKWSPDGTSIALIAYKDGASDIYLYSFSTGTLQNLTKDVFSDHDVAWSFDGKYIYFASDRGDNLILGANPVDGIAQAAYVRASHDLYRLELATQQISRITATPRANEMNPTLTRSGTLLFISDANGINNVYASKPEGGDARPLTNSVSKIDQISISHDGSKLAFSAVRKGGYNLYIMRNPLDRQVDAIPPTTFRQSFVDRVAVRDSLIERYMTDSTGIVKDEHDTVTGYGNVGIDLDNYVYSDEPTLERSSMSYKQRRAAEPITNYKDSLGNYIEREYKVFFSSDVILGTAGYTGYYGLQGSAQMLFSDELGNHQLYFATNLLLDLQNSDYLLAYFNLSNRINFGLQGFHSARFLYTTPDPGYEQYDYFLSRFRTYGLTGIASYPFDRFNRIDLNFSTLVLEKDVIEDFVDIETKRKYAFVPTVSYIHDNVLWSYFYPKSGTRYNFSLSATPAIGNNVIGFVTPQFDVRNYMKITGDLTLAARITGAASFGPNPQRFFLGGVDGWINRLFSDQTYPLTEPEDFAFFNSASPLRGFPYNERIGTKYVLGNAALRFPFPFYVAGAPLALLGEVFTDAGAAWDNNLYLFQKNSDGSWRTRDILLSTGLGLRTYLFGIYLKMDIAWTTDLGVWSTPQYIFSLGEDF